MIRPHENQDGFTLIEIIAAIAIVGVALVPMLQAYVISWEAAIQADRTATALMLGRWKLGQVQVEQGYLNAASTSGNFGADWRDEDYEDYYYRIEVEEFSGAHPEFSGKRVLVWIEYYDIVTGRDRTIHCSDAAECDRPDLFFLLTDQRPSGGG